MLKDGYKVQQGLEEAVYRNIAATVELGNVVRTSYGPNGDYPSIYGFIQLIHIVINSNCSFSPGRNKMVINHLEKLFVTNDAATIIKELEVVHPAAKMVVLASQQQESEVIFLLLDGVYLIYVGLQTVMLRLLLPLPHLSTLQMGDGTNLVIVLATELLSNAEFLLRMGLHPSEVIDGFEIAAKKALEILDGMLLHGAEFHSFKLTSRCPVPGIRL